MTEDYSCGESCLVLIAHGSRNPGWTAPFEQLVKDLEAEAGSRRILLAFMELARPTLLDVAEELRRNGTGRIQLLPLFLASGNHLALDIPAQVKELKLRYPEMEVEILPAIGQHPKFFATVREIAEEYREMRR